AAGVTAAGGTLGAMLPPSTVLAVYGIITEQDIGKLFIAGIVPGILAASMYMITVGVIVWARPKYFRPVRAPRGGSGSKACAISGRRCCFSSSSSAASTAACSRRRRPAAWAQAAHS